MLLLLSCFSVTPPKSPGRIPEGQDLTGSTISIFSLLADLFPPGHCMGQGLTLVQSPVAGGWGCVCSVLSWVTHFWETQPPACEDTQAAL